MGQCVSAILNCLQKKGGEPSETELANVAAEKAKLMGIDANMSAPGIQIWENTMCKGSGLALVGVPVEQDAAYWEWHILLDEGYDNSQDDDQEAGGKYPVKVGVSTEKNKDFYQMLQAGDDGEDKIDDDGTKFMHGITNLKEDMVIGVAVQYSDLPMIQFFINGEYYESINRFRGTVYPSIYLRGCDGVSARLVVGENELRHKPPSGKYGPLMMASRLV